MREDTLQVIGALVLVNLIAWGGYTYIQEEPAKEYIDKVIYQQPDVTIANVTVNIDYNGAESNATKNTNMTVVAYNVTVVNDTSAYAATLEAGKGNFEIIVTWHDQWGAYIKEIDGVSGDGYSWGLYHNGKTAALGAASLILQEKDTITWKYESY
tara:strand:- start:2059 stop:2523 length:465 start_codon:yes stop_codon:yes gene_type:complete